MATFWEAITENSSLPIEVGNTLWMHINNQQEGSSDNTYIVSNTRSVSISQGLSANINRELSAEITENKLSAEKNVSLSAATYQILEASICQ